MAQVIELLGGATDHARAANCAMNPLHLVHEESDVRDVDDDAGDDYGHDDDVGE